MAAMFVAALAVPSVFEQHGVVFGVSFSSSRSCSWRCMPSLRAATTTCWRRFSVSPPGRSAGRALILVAGFVHGAAQAALWLVALLVGFVGPLFTGVAGWRVHPEHFVERHGLIVIIAIGESSSRSGSARERRG